LLRQSSDISPFDAKVHEVSLDRAKAEQQKAVPCFARDTILDEVYLEGRKFGPDRFGLGGRHEEQRTQGRPFFQVECIAGRREARLRCCIVRARATVYSDVILQSGADDE
jgi:hypothetical protein